MDTGRYRVDGDPTTGDARLRPRLARVTAVVTAMLWACAATAGGAGDPARPAAASSVKDGPVLPLSQLVQRVVKANRTVGSRRADQALAVSGVDRARAAFQSQVTMSASTGASLQANSREEQIVRSGAGIYDRESLDVSASISRLLGSGTKVEGKATLSRFLTNVSKVDEYRTFYGVTLTHPLARDGGVDATMARVRVAESEVAGSGAAVRDAEGSVAAQAVFAYWDLTLAQHRVAHSSEKIAMGERLLAQAQAASRQGRLPESQVLDVESDLIRYRAAVVEARTAQVEAAAQIAALLGDSLEALGGRPRAVEALPGTPGVLPDADQAMARARESRADLRQRRAVLEREQVQMSYALNQARPKVDVVASYGFNGGPSRSQAVGVASLKDFPAWSVGLQVAMPLGDNQQARADIQAARLRAQEAERQLQALEVTIGNDIRTGLALMAGAAERWRLWSEVAHREERHVLLERQRLEAGRSDLREVLFREERAINARLAVIEQQVAWAKADALVEAAQGTLVERYR